MFNVQCPTDVENLKLANVCNLKLKMMLNFEHNVALMSKEPHDIFGRNKKTVAFGLSISHDL